MDFVCVKEGCTGKSFTTLRGWKSHMSRMHGGYDEQDMKQAMLGAGTPEDDVAQRMQAFAATLPGGPSTEGASGEAEPSASGTEKSDDRPPAAPPPIKTIKATPKQLKKVLGGFPRFIFESNDFKLDEEDIKALDEAGEFLVDLFALEFEVDQQKTLVHNRMWAFVWVGGVCVVIYMKHKFRDVWKNLYDAYTKRQAAEKLKPKAAA